MSLRPQLVSALIAVTFLSAVSVEAAETVCVRPGAGFFTRIPGGAKGLEHDILSSFSVASSVALSFKDSSSFEDVLKDTESGVCAIGSATITITPERTARFEFSAPYFPNRILIVQKSTSGFTGPADLNGKRVAAVPGTVSAPLVSAMPGVKSVSAANDDAAFAALLKGEVDALACDSAVVLSFLARHPELGIAFPIGERSYFGFAFPRNSTLAKPLSDHIRKLVKSGEMKTLLAKHFGAANAEVLVEDIAQAVAQARP